MFFIGVTRFSLFYPHAPGWNLTGRYTDVAEYEKALFAPSRLNPRVDIFLNYSLPQLDLASRGRFYKHVVQISPQLPAKVKGLLRDAAEKYPFLVISEQSTAKGHRLELDDIIRQAAADSDSADGLFVRFRLDDDDLLSSSFFDQLEPYACDSNVGLNISFGTGYQAVYYEGTVFNLRHLYHPRNSMGMAQVCRLRHSGNIEWREFSNHARSDKDVPTILDSRIPTVMSLKHNGQDTFAGGDSAGGFGKATRLLAGEPPADYIELTEKFPILQDAIVRPISSRDFYREDGSQTPLSTDAQPLEIEFCGPGIYELDFCYDSSDAQDDRRLFISFPIRLKSIEYPWNEYMSDSVVAGVPFSPLKRARIPLLLQNGERVNAGSIWQSRAASRSNRLISLQLSGRKFNV